METRSERCLVIGSLVFSARGFSVQGLGKSRRRWRPSENTVPVQMIAKISQDPRSILLQQVTNQKKICGLRLLIICYINVILVRLAV